MIKRNISLHFVVFLFIISASNFTDERNVCFNEHAVNIADIFNPAETKLPPENAKPYSVKKNNGKFKAILQYVSKKANLLPEIKQLQQARKEQLLCLAINMYQEARGSTENDQKGVGYVTMNRSDNKDFPDTICEVVWQTSQFSWTVNDINDILPKEQDAWTKIQTIALEIYKQKMSKYYAYFDITKGATHFYAPSLCKAPIWSKQKSVETKEKIGGHIYIKMANKL